MIVNSDALGRDISIINENSIRRISDFLQGAVYCWCNMNPGKWFSMRDLMGGENRNWTNTPLNSLYEACENIYGVDQAYDEAGKNAGWILKSVIINDIRHFNTDVVERIRKYQFIH